MEELANYGVVEVHTLLEEDVVPLIIESVLSSLSEKVSK